MAKIRTRAMEAVEQEEETAARVKAIVEANGIIKTADHPKSLLQQAHEVIHGDREKTYGDPAKNLNNIASYWSIHLSASCGEKITLTAQDVCVMMILLKQARLVNTPADKDSLLDTAGYAALADLIR